MLRSFARPLRILFEFLAGFAGALVVLWLLLIWRLSNAPMNLAFLTPYTQEAIAGLIPGTQVAVANSQLTWDNADHSVSLHADGINLSGKNEQKIAVIPSLDIRISIWGLVIGRLVPAGLHIEHPQIWIDRTADGTLLFGGMAAPGKTDGSGDMKGALVNIADDLVHAHFMRKLEIRDAVFAMHDESANNDWTVELPDVVLARHLGGELTGDAKIKVTQGARTALAVVHYNYNRDGKRHDIAANFSGINPATLADPGSSAAAVNLPLTGEVSFQFNDGLELMGGAIDMKGDPGTLEHADFWDTPCAIKGLEAKADYDRHTGRLNINKAMIDFGGPKLSLVITGAPPADKSSDLAFDMAVKLTALPMDSFAHIWPKPIITGAREWIAASLSKGTFDKAEATFKGSLKWNDLGDMAITDGSGSVSASNGTVNYLEGMPPVTGVSANGDFDLNHMTIAITGGSTGDLKLQPSTIVLSDFEKDIQTIDLPVKFTGPLPAVLKLIDAPRFRYAQALGLKPDDVQGTMNGWVEMKFPLLKDLQMKDADIKAGGDMTDLASTTLVKGLDISEGDLTLALDKGGFTLNGKAGIQKIPLLVTWQESFKEDDTSKPLRHATLTGDVSGEQWGRLGIGMLKNTQGPIAITLEMTQKTKKSTSFTGTLDMKNATMDISDMGWKKPANTPASLNFAAEMLAGKDINVTSLTADGPGLSIKGKAVFASSDLKPLSINLNPFAVGRTDAVVHFTQTPGANGKISLNVDGKSFDVSGFHGSDDKETDPRPKEFHVKLGKLYTSESGYISDITANAVRDLKGWSQISLHGLADGGHALAIELTPQPDGHRTFLISCDDFGKALKGLGFTDTVKDGKLKVSGTSTVDNPRLIEGKANIGHFQVKDLPVLVVLMNATSPFGIFNLFTGTLDFDHLEGKFRWQGDALDLDDVRASGDSVGMTIDGKLDLNNGAADLHGTMAPFSMFNRIIGSIPLIGDMLTGGEGQGVLGVTYTIKGMLDKPDVSVNPASLLTPGFLRNLFFGGSDDDDDEPAKPANVPSAKPAVPAAQPAQAKSSAPAATNFNK